MFMGGYAPRGHGATDDHRARPAGRVRTVPIDSRSALAAIQEETLAGTGTAASAAVRATPLYIVASPRPQVGKTFVARLLTDFLRLDDGDAIAFDLNPGGKALRDFLPKVASATDLSSIRHEMALFDRLIVADGIAKVVDLGSAWFDRFFAIMEETGFVPDAGRRSIEPFILFAADPHPASAKAYADLRARFPAAVVVPVFNQAILKKRKVRDQFKFSRAASVPLQIPFLAPQLKAFADKSAYSFADFHSLLPSGVPLGPAFELRTWTRRTFLEFRELELRLLLDRLRAALPGVELSAS
jgi:hypothetical protein